MKIIEQILLELNGKNLAEQIQLIHNQLEYYSNHKMDMAGISLMAVRDMLDVKYTDELLRGCGFILNIAQFKEACEKFLKLAGRDPILFNSQLKRLHRSFQVLRQNYVVGNIKNARVVSEMKNAFSQSLLSYYCDGTNVEKKMPKALRELIAKQIETRVNELNEAWHSHAADKAGAEISEVMSKRLLEDWTNGVLNPAIVKKLAEEKTALNSIDALITCFRRKELPNEIQEEIKKGIVAEITTEIGANNITTNDELGAAIHYISSKSLQKEDFHHVTKLLVDWQNNQTDQAVSVRLEKYLDKIIRGMKQRLDSSLTQQFAKLAVNAFVDKLQHGYYPQDMGMKDYSVNLLKQILLHSSSVESTLPNSRDMVYNDVMQHLHQDWIKGSLPADLNEYIGEVVFSDLIKLDDAIQAQVWPNKAKQSVEKLVSDNAELQSKVTQLESMMEKLMARLEGKIAGADNAAASTVPNNATSVSFFSAKR